MAQRNIYKDYYGLQFTKIYWSKLASIHIDRATSEYRCDCCGKQPTECNNQESAEEYKKIEKVIDKTDIWGSAGLNYPVYDTGWIRYDNNSDARLISKIQRELAKSAGFKLRRSSFW